jgi:hypothetical protein
LAILDPDGKLVMSQKKGEFESTSRRRQIPETVEALTQRFMKLQAQSSTLPFN